MQLITKHDSFHLIRFDKGEEVIETLKQYCGDNRIQAGSFQALGAAGNILLSYYNLATKEYEDRKIQEDVEIVSMLGNIAVLKDTIIVHTHGVFSKQDFSTIGGHIKSLTVSATCEISLTTIPGKISRAYDETTGLNLLE